MSGYRSVFTKMVGRILLLKGDAPSSTRDVELTRLEAGFPASLMKTCITTLYVDNVLTVLVSFFETPSLA